MNHRRVTLSKKQKAQKILDQKSLCGCGCEEKLVKGNIAYDHKIPIWKRPKRRWSKQDEYNGQYAIREDPCHKLKTKREAPERAHHKRLERARLALVDGVPKPKRRNGSKLKSPGFYKHPTLKQQIGGKVVPRREKT